MPADLADRARAACTKLAIDAPEVRRELWEDITRIADLDQRLIRPGRVLTNEMVVGLSKAIDSAVMFKRSNALAEPPQ